MLKQTIDILSAPAEPQQHCVMGNVAIARGAIEAGVNGVFAYPGTPSTELSEVFRIVDDFQRKPENELKYPGLTERKIYFEYSINEKVALEKAIACSIGNRAALCVMKNVGMNVACDALMSIAYQTIVAPLVVVVCDDPGCHSSSNEQDSRYWGLLANVPVFNPANPAEAAEMTRQAFRLSAELKMPVIVRTTTRVSHARGVVHYRSFSPAGRPAHFDRLPEHINIPARTAAAHDRLLDKLKAQSALEMLALNSRVVEGASPEFGIITSGVSFEYADEILHRHGLMDRVAILNLGLVHPFPEKEVLQFLEKDLEKILVLEELDPILENAVRVIAQKNGIRRQILGKGFSGLKAAGEFSLDIIEKAIEALFGQAFSTGQSLPAAESRPFLDKLPPRPPALCSGCPHRATFYLLKLAIPRDNGEMILCGDIGCFGLGALPPLKMIDTINHMGMSVSMAQGLNEAFRAANRDEKLVAMLGDGTFFHSGLSSLVNAVYTRANILLVIFDNRTIGMTGHQSHPGAVQRLPKYCEIDIPPLLRGLGIEVVETVNPYDLRDGYAKLRRAMEHRGVSVIVAKAPCVFLPDFKERMDLRMTIVVDETRCNTCANHQDLALACSRCYSPASNLTRARQKLFAPLPIPGDEQRCPANICNHGFFYSILDGDYHSAVDIVRDKMLFARTCGDICHRPCELFAPGENAVPIKALKKFVSSFDEHFRDFSRPVARAKNAAKKNKCVAVAGAGPAGLSAAYDLLQAGYTVDIFEKEQKAGGMVAFAIPGFRMDKTGFDYEAMQLEAMGAHFHFNRALGRDFTLEKLAGEYDAVVLAIGMGRSKTLNAVENSVAAANKTGALAFLRSFNLGERKIKDGSTILVIGGGNSAVDAARAAKKLYAGNRVVVSCIETEDAMPAFAEETAHARGEGIAIICDSRVEARSRAGRAEAELYRFSSGELLQTLTCDLIVTAIGQESDTEALGEIPKSRFDRQGRILPAADTASAGAYPNVFAAGDLASGNHTSVIGAIAAGKKAALGVRKHLENYPYEYEGEAALNRLNTTPPPAASGKEYLAPGSFTVNGSLEAYDLFQSCMKCNHCIDNFGCPAMVKENGKVKIDAGACTLCGLCIDVCPNNAIRWETVKETTH